MDSDLERWLLNTDPSLRWQVERDLLDAPVAVWRATRARVANEGFGARLLALQDADGQWAGGSFFPKGFDFEGPEAQPGAGQPWTATTWTLNSLREWGLDAAALAGTAEKLAANCRWDYDNLPYWGGEVDCCINSWTLSNGLWLGADVDGLVDWFLEHQLPDGGWNCEWVEGATVSSFHSTLNALKALLDYELATGDRGRTQTARHRGEEYLLSRRLLYRATTGQVVGPWATQLVWPWRWRYSVLNALDYSRAAFLHDGRTPDPRLADAIQIVVDARTSGRWLQQARLAGRVWFETDVAPGAPSPWVTFYALRALGWWDRFS